MEWRRVRYRGLSFDIPAAWKVEKGDDATISSPDGTTAVIPRVVATKAATGEEVITGFLESVEDAWTSKVRSRHFAFGTGVLRIDANKPMRVTANSTIINGKAYGIICAHTKTKAVSNECMRILTSLDIDEE